MIEDRADPHAVVVEVDGLRYGILTADVVELLPMVNVTPLPGAPAVVEGVINWRGSIIAVIEVRRRIGAPARPALPGDRLVVVSIAERMIALRVDAGLDLASFSWDAVKQPGSTLPLAEHVAGVVATADGLLVIYDLGEFLSAEEDQLLGAALEEAAREVQT